MKKAMPDEGKMDTKKDTGKESKEAMGEMRKPGLIGLMISHAKGPVGKGVPMHDPKKDKHICACTKASK